MSDSVTDHRTPPPFWLPVLAGLPVGLCLFLMALPIMGHGSATLSRTLYLLAFVLWVLPLTWLQRWLWRRRAPAGLLVAALLLVTYLMALATRLLSLAIQGALPMMIAAFPQEPGKMFRGLEGAWLVLVAYCAVHAVVAYYAELRREREDHLASRLAARDAELLALRYQIQPHFLFNVLNAISALSAEGKAQEAQRMIARLADFLRAVLEPRDGHEVALAEEVAVTEGYLDIERIRLGSRLRLSWRIDPNVLAERVPYLLLQPLVENAVRHGLAPRVSPGELEILIQRKAGRLIISVVNDVPDDRMTEPSLGVEKKSLGLENVRGRLSRLYPQDATLDAGYRQDGRYCVEVSLPRPVTTGGFS